MTDKPPPPHGVYLRYVNYGCRCDECRTALGQYQKHRKEVRTARLREDPSLAPHGSSNTYKNWGCRCGPCRNAYSHPRKKVVDRGRRIPLRVPPSPRAAIPPFGREWIVE